MSSTVCFVGAPEWPRLSDDDRLLIPSLDWAGIAHASEPWDRPGVDWPGFDAVVVRSTWDYYVRIEEFRAWIEARAVDGTNLWNPASVLRWNSDKRYLRRLADAGVDVVQAEWTTPSGGADAGSILRECGWDRGVVKPVVSAGGYRTSVVEAGRPVPEDAAALLAETDAMVQPFLDQIVDEGEWSLVFFGRTYSHAVVKRPRPNGFLVQPKHGGTLVDAVPEPWLVDAARRVLDAVDEDLLYARVDGVVDRATRAFTLIELEVFEPVLFFGQDPASPSRFVEALTARLR